MLGNVLVEALRLDLISLDDRSNEEEIEEADQGLNISSVDEAPLARQRIREVLYPDGAFET